jgi:Ca2+-transporting ATPase
MTVVQEYTDDSVLMATAMALCSDAELRPGEESSVGEPTEAALVNYALKIGLPKYELEAAQARVAEAPFDSDRKMMSTIHQKENAFIQYTKGACDMVLPRCTGFLKNGQVIPMTEDVLQEILKVNKSFADQALRVLAAAYRTYDTMPEDTSPAGLEQSLILIGLYGMIDPCRPEVYEAIEKCRMAGIRPIMITGDHKDTAVAIGKDLGIIKSAEEACLGSELDKYSDEELVEAVSWYSVYARVQPEHKTRIVNAWQARGMVTAMTGDGVNDAPSLKAADIGVAMGIGGTEVAKDAAEVILVDDNFITIKNAVMEGRNLFNNIKKSVVYLLRSNFGEVVLMASSIFAGLSSPLSTIQILWVNLLTDTAPSLALGMDIGSDTVMNEKPRNVKSGIVNRGGYMNISIQGLISGGVALLAFLLPVISKYGTGNILGNLSGNEEMLKMCRTYCFSTLAINELLMAYVCKTRGSLAFATKESWNNKALNVITVIGILLQLGVLVIPPLRSLLKLAALSAGDIAVILLIAVAGVLVNAAITLAKERLDIRRERNL